MLYGIDRTKLDSFCSSCSHFIKVEMSENKHYN